MEDVALNREKTSGATQEFEFSVPSMSCGSCVAKIESAMAQLPGVESARANLTLKRLLVYATDDITDHAIIERLKSLSFDAFRIDDEAKADTEHQAKARSLLRAMAVAGFGSANIMLLSVSAWSGADGATRDLFHLVSALIAVPVVLFSGQPFFRSALSGLSVGRINMDFPISLAVILALLMSIFQTMTGQPEAYFDAAVMLLFFLLIGRYLDQLMRTRARNAVVSLSQYATKQAIVVGQNGDTSTIEADQIETGMVLRLHAGSRVPADSTIISGSTDIDRSMVTGEAEPVSARSGDSLEAGTLNLTGSVDVRVDKPVNQSFLAEVTRMLNAAEQGKSQYIRIADRAARIYTPAVHTLAGAAFISWMMYTGGDWQVSLLVAISVLIITCPCALGLAVPVAHVVSASQLFRHGLLMRDGAALEKLANVTRAVFDKTGTVTMGIKTVDAMPHLSAAHHNAIATLASHSSHPSSMAICNHLKPFAAVELEAIKELPGHGIEAIYQGKRLFIGRGADESTTIMVDDAVLGTVSFTEQLRPGARNCLNTLRQAGISTQLLSGDSSVAVERIANRLGISDFHFGQTPKDKMSHVSAAGDGEAGNTLMVGDGINDAPCLAAADVSIAPSSAADVGRQASDFVMARDSLDVVPWAIVMAKRTDRIVRQNFALAIIYNCIAVPLAFLGYASPLFAAIAMSLSSIVVIANSLRLMHTSAPANAVKENKVGPVGGNLQEGAVA
ncbi:MAG: heavy metal translocating P-type ATPase [Pseudomonadota bacterium]